MYTLKGAYTPEYSYYSRRSRKQEESPIYSQRWAITTDISQAGLDDVMGTDVRQLITSMNISRETPMDCTWYLDHTQRDDTRNDGVVDSYYYGTKPVDRKGFIAELKLPLYTREIPSEADTDEALKSELDRLLMVARLNKDGIFVKQDDDYLELFDLDEDLCRGVHVVEGLYTVQKLGDYLKLVYEPDRATHLGKRKARARVAKPRRATSGQLATAMASKLRYLVWEDNEVMYDTVGRSYDYSHFYHVSTAAEWVLKVWKLGVDLRMTKVMRKEITPEIKALADWWPTLTASCKLGTEFNAWLTVQCDLLKIKLKQPKAKKSKDTTNGHSNNSADGAEQQLDTDLDPRGDGAEQPRTEGN